MDSEKDRDKEQREKEGPRIPLMSKWSSMMDDLIDEAMSEGYFDNLPGQGKPLKLNKNPYGRESELAFELLKHNEYTLPWIAERSQLLTEIEELREEISRIWTEYSQDYQASRDEVVQAGLKVAWAKQLDSWREQIAALNNRIDATNLKQPGERLEIYKLTLGTELKRAGAGTALKQ